MDGKTRRRIARARVDLDSSRRNTLRTVLGSNAPRWGVSRRVNAKVSAVELVELAAALGVPLAWFVRDPLPAVVSRRTDAAPSRRGDRRLDRQLELFSGDVAALLATGVIAGEDRERVWRLPRDHTEAETTAAQVRKHLAPPIRRCSTLPEPPNVSGLYSCSLPLGAGGADGRWWKSPAVSRPR